MIGMSCKSEQLEHRGAREFKGRLHVQRRDGCYALDIVIVDGSLTLS
jgi:hypothetical protein